jgi:hypothetical protein
MGNGKGYKVFGAKAEFENASSPIDILAGWFFSQPFL